MITIIAAIGLKNELGNDNKLLWSLSRDLKHFKDKTFGHPVIMGRKTYESIGKPLPNRTNLVLSSNKNWFEEGILIVNNLKEAIKFAKKIDPEVFIIGGGKIYEQAIMFADKLEITLVNSTFGADTFFPKIDPKLWKKTKETFYPKDEKNEFDMYFQTYEKILAE